MVGFKKQRFRFCAPTRQRRAGLLTTPATLASSSASAGPQTSVLRDSLFCLVWEAFFF